MENEKRLIDAVSLADKVFTITLCATGMRNGKTLLKELLEKYRNEVLRTICKEPTVDAVEVVHGRWETVDHDGSWRVDMCSICHRRMHYVDYDQPYQYCPNCGAKMDGGNKDV